MRLTNRQDRELIVWKYFVPQEYKHIPQKENDLRMFFEWSEQGKHKDMFAYGEPIKKHAYLYALIQGKVWAGIHVGMYEEGVLDGSMPYSTILGGLEDKPIPREVVDFMKKEMFKGQDAEAIEMQDR